MRNGYIWAGKDQDVRPVYDITHWPRVASESHESLVYGALHALAAQKQQ